VCAGDGGYGSAGSVERGLQEVTDNVQHFCNNGTCVAPGVVVYQYGIVANILMTDNR